MRAGIYFGTRSWTKSGAKRCSAPKTANGGAKHTLAKATILSTPRAVAISFLAAHAPISRITAPAEHIPAAVRGLAKNMARTAGCIDFVILEQILVCYRGTDSTTHSTPS